MIVLTQLDNILRCLTILVPALNEEAKLETMVNSLLPVARSSLNQFEIILFDDGSTDKTGAIADHLATTNPEIRVIHHNPRQGLGAIFYEGLTESQFDHLTVIPGDNAYNAEGLRPAFQAIGTADLIISYRANSAQTRAVHRVIISSLYARIMSLLFGLKLRDIHSVVIYPVARAKQLKLQLTNYTYQLEILVKLIRNQPTIMQVPVLLNPDTPQNSRSLNWKTFGEVFKLLSHLLFDRPS